MPNSTFKPYTVDDVRNAEILLANTCNSSSDQAVRARSKMVLALIELLDAHSYSWRVTLAQQVNEARLSGKLPNFNPDWPFELTIASTDYLATLAVGNVTGASLLGSKNNDRGRH